MFHERLLLPLNIMMDMNNVMKIEGIHIIFNKMSSIRG